jgi:hypothetical protein
MEYLPAGDLYTAIHSEQKKSFVAWEAQGRNILIYAFFFLHLFLVLFLYFFFSFFFFFFLFSMGTWTSGMEVKTMGSATKMTAQFTTMVNGTFINGQFFE